MNPAPTLQDDVPEDMRLPRDFVPASLDEQIKVARKVLAAWREQNEHRTERQYGHGAMHPLTYAQGLQVRRSVLHSLITLKANQAANGEPA